DIQTLQNHESRIKNQEEKKIIQSVMETLNRGERFSTEDLPVVQQKIIQQLSLLSSKPEIIVLNVSESDYTEENIAKLIAEFSSLMGIPQDKFVVISAQVEAELAELSPEDQVQ